MREPAGACVCTKSSARSRVPGAATCWSQGTVSRSGNSTQAAAITLAPLSRCASAAPPTPASANADESAGRRNRSRRKSDVERTAMATRGSSSRGHSSRGRPASAARPSTDNAVPGQPSARAHTAKYSIAITG